MLIPEETRIVRALWDGLSQQQIAGRLGLSPRRIHHRVRLLKRRVGASSTIALLRRCVQAGVLTP